MIKRALISFVVIFIGYNLFLVYFIPIWDTCKHQWDENNVNAENYISNHKKYESVIVGTSLSQSIITDSLPKFYNLSFAGKSIYDGLNIILRSEAKPKHIFIETNFPLRMEDPLFLNQNCSYLSTKLKSNFPSLKKSNEPIAAFGNEIFYDVCATLIINLRTFLNLNDSKAEEKLNSDFFNSSTHQEKVKTPELNKESIKFSFDKLSILVSTLKKKGIKIIFFEMPESSLFSNSPSAKILRNKFKTVFKENQFDYIPNSSYIYDTTDGHHLGECESLHYTCYFNKNVTELLKLY